MPLMDIHTTIKYFNPISNTHPTYPKHIKSQGHCYPQLLELFDSVFNISCIYFVLTENKTLQIRDFAHVTDEGLQHLIGEVVLREI